MDSARRAVVDVGTNSVKLLVADVTSRDMQPVCEQSKQTRLGAGLFPDRRLRPESIASTAAAVAQFARTARELSAGTIRVIATSAARDALNATELVEAIRSAAGLEVQVISGEQEAEWAFRGVTTHSTFAGRALLLLDVGGGSTEFILGRDGQKHFSASFPLGTLRLLEQFKPSDPPVPSQRASCRQWIENFLAREVQPQLEPELARETAAGLQQPQLVGTGGTTTILARLESALDTFDRSRIEATLLSLEAVRDHSRRLWSAPLAERQQFRGLPPNRADVILMGVLFYEVLMEQFHFSDLRVSTRGLRFAALMSP